MSPLLLFCLGLLLLVLAAGWISASRKARVFRRRLRPTATEGPSSGAMARPKPPWVVEEVLRLKALMPLNGCRKIAASFNHLHRRKRVTVGKTYVATVLEREGYRLAEIRREIRRRKPRRVPKNLIWGLDLTYVRHADESRPVLGLLDHGTRACLALRDLPSKSTITVLRALLDVVERFGTPKVIRTDNEAVFTSVLFRIGLRILGVRHQTTAPVSPWENGRIERFFSSFKERFRLRPTQSMQLQTDLDFFRVWYNYARPHQSLAGLTPAMTWNRPRAGGGRRKPRFFSEWDGVLSGYLFR